MISGADDGSESGLVLDRAGGGAAVFTGGLLFGKATSSVETGTTVIWELDLPSGDRAARDLLGP